MTMTMLTKEELAKWQHKKSFLMYYLGAASYRMGQEKDETRCIEASQGLGELMPFVVSLFHLAEHHIGHVSNIEDHARKYLEGKEWMKGGPSTLAIDVPGMAEKLKQAKALLEAWLEAEPGQGPAGDTEDFLITLDSDSIQ